MAIRFLYSIFLGILVALFIGLGVAAFYKAPKAPDYPITLQNATSVTKEGVVVESEETKTARIQYEKEQKEYNKLFSTYSRNVSIITLIAAVIVLVISLFLADKIQLISDGLLFGGVLTLLYSIIRGFMGEDEIYRFLVATAGLIMAFIVGYVKFIKPDKQPSKR